MSNLILSSTDAVTVPKSRTFACLNGPCEGKTVDAPYDTTPGNACALKWAGPQGERYAVYLLVEYQARLGLMYMKSYQTPERAQVKVRELTAICARGDDSQN